MYRINHFQTLRIQAFAVLLALSISPQSIPTMEMVGRIMSKTSSSLGMTEELKEARNNRVITESMEDTEWLEMPKAGLRWKRLVIMLGVAENHATTGAIITYLEQMRKRIAEEKYEEYKRAAGSSADKVLKPKNKSQTGTKPMAKGKALSRSTACQYTLDPEVCPHAAEDLSEPRGGRGGAKWFTCLKCGSRWERVESTTTTPSTESIPTSSPQTSPSVNLTPPVAKRKVEMFPTATASDSPSVFMTHYDWTPTASGAEIFSRLDAVYNEMNKSMTETQCIHEMMTRARNPEEISAVRQFCALKFQWKDAK